MPSGGYSKKKNIKRAALRMLLSLISLAVLTFLAISLIRGGGKLDLAGIPLFGRNVAATAFYFDDGRSGAFADLGGALVSVGPLGAQVFDSSGNEVGKETAVIGDPTICSRGGAAAAYDLGGTDLILLGKSGVRAKLTTDYPIISASVNADGWCAVSTQFPGYKGLVTVYDASGDQRYWWKSGTGYPLSASVADDDKGLAVLTLTSSGSKITFFSLDSDSPDGQASYAQDGKLLLDIGFMDDDTLAAVGKDALYTISKDGKELSALDYDGKFLSGFDLGGDGFAVLCLNDYQVGGQGTIETVDKEGKVMGGVDGAASAVSAKGGYVAVLRSDSLTIYDKSLGALKTYSGISGADGALMRADGAALVTKAGSAIVYSSK